MRTIVIIGPEAIHGIETVRAYAERPENWRHLPEDPEQAANVPVPGDTRQHVLYLEMGVKCVYSIDVEPTGEPWRHLSVSIHDPSGRYQDPRAPGNSRVIAQLVYLWGFGVPSGPSFNLGTVPGERFVVHAVAPFDPDANPVVLTMEDGQQIRESELDAAIFMARAPLFMARAPHEGEE